MKKILFAFGTRPEAIKLAPLINLMKRDDRFFVEVCVTAQHRQMLDQVLDFFKIIPEYDLDLMTPDQTLFKVTASALNGMENVLSISSPELVVVQGDTTTVFVAALAAFYKHIPVAHVEAGLRSFNKQSPFPEEMNRLLTTQLSYFHFVPTEESQANLLNERVTKHVYQVGNTVVDALQLGLSMVLQHEKHYLDFFSDIDFSKKIILVTCHRRESFGEPFRNICRAFLEIAQNNKDVEIIYPVHLNPNVSAIAHEMLQTPNIKLLPPLEYPYLIYLMSKCYLVLTDSGGIQEEAPSLGKPVLVLRDVTERTEGIAAGTALLVGTDFQKIVMHTQRLLNDKVEYAKMSKAVNPYGDGTTSQKIVEILSQEWL